MQRVDTLYVSDLDGTLFNHRGLLTEATRAGLIGLLERGLPFTVATARSLASMNGPLAGLPIVLPVVALNGAFVSDLATGKHYHCQPIDSRIVRELSARGQALSLPPYISAFDGHCDHLYVTEPVNAGQLWYLNDRQNACDPRLRRVADIAAAFADTVVCVTFISPREHLAPLAEWIGETFAGEVYTHLYENTYDPGWYWLTAHDRRATKAQGLATLADMLGVSLSQVTVFGDNDNDISMFKEAGRGVAVGNAIDALKCHASEVVATNEENAVIAWLQANWTNGQP